jgi:hypothetical protein
MVNLICGEGRRGAHRSGRPAVVQSGKRGNSLAAWTEGCRWWTSGRGVPVDHWKAFRSSCVAGRGRRMADDGELYEIEDATVELGNPASVADASSCKWMLDDAGMTAVQTLGPNGDGVQWGWPVPVRSKLSGWAESGGYSVDARNRNGIGKTLPVHARGDDIAQATWAVATGGVWSLVHHCLRCHVRGRATGTAG